MSRSSSSEMTDFDRWLPARYAESEGFTALLLLVRIGAERVDLLSCAWLHVIGPETRWAEMRAMVDQSRHRWDAVALFAENAPGGGPLLDVVAKARLQERIDEVTADRMALNAAGFFDPQGRAVRIDPAEAGA